MQQSTAQQLIDELGLLPHVEGGWYAVTEVAFPELAPGAVKKNYSGPRQTASLIYYMLQKGEVSCWHKLLSGELWLWHCGGSLEMTLGGSGGEPVAQGALKLGPRLALGERFQILAPAGEWQTTRVVDGDFVLVSCVVSPAFHPDDCVFEHGSGKVASM